MTAPAERPISAGRVEAVVREAFGPGHPVTGARELTDGTYNSVWRLRVDGVGPVVLKVAPPDGTPGLTYERHIARTEAMVLRLAAPTVPVPVLHHLGCDSPTAGGDFLVLSEVPGESWKRWRRRLDGTTRGRLRRELGELVARLHGIGGTEFGYPRAEVGLRAGTWPDAFTLMLRAVLDDAARYRVRLPVDAAEILALADRQRPLLAEVREPRLVHFDLWEGNIMLAAAPDGPRITGLLDAERAFWGDPHAEFVSLSLLDEPAADPDLLDGYRRAGGVLDLGPGVRRKLRLYEAYLYLIMMVEVTPRGAGPEGLVLRRIVHGRLKKTLRRLRHATEEAAP
jgi:aminoglycoside phosphotransferase (APT) family kinase protein